ncbi:MAG: succinylglutamate desuccinylase/aspartoacylase family protein [Acidimicrobiales bacterium]
MAPRRRPPFELGGVTVQPGQRRQTELPIARLVSGSQLALPVIMLHGRSDGPTLWLTAAIHGDEVAGTEIIRRVLARLDPRDLRGTLVALPVVNVHGFNTNDRYLPDRRDLNRSFPGSSRGSLASRIADLLMTEVVTRSDVGIDLHTGAAQRTNLPQIRADLSDLPTAELAAVFGAPIAVHARIRDGSLRHAATEAGVTVLLFEGGEASRLEQDPVTVGTSGVLRVMAELDMIDEHEVTAERTRLMSARSTWMRANRSGMVHLEAALGDVVTQNQPLASVYDPYGKRLGTVRSRVPGLIIGQTRSALLTRGDALAHVAELTHVDMPPATWAHV